MKLEQQVCSIEPAKRLKELEVKQESIYFYDEDGVLLHKGSYAKEKTSAFLVSELSQFLPKNENIVTMLFTNGNAQIAIQGNIELEEGLGTQWGAAGHCIGMDCTEADARAKMLVYLLENKLITL